TDIVLSFLPAAGPCPPAGTRSVQPERLLRGAGPRRRGGAVERKGRHAGEKALAAVGLHLVIADHEARRGRQRAAAGVFEAGAGRQDRLLADDARPAHLLQPAEAVDDLPVTVAQLHGLVAAILD